VSVVLTNGTTRKRSEKTTVIRAISPPANENINAAMVALSITGSMCSPGMTSANPSAPATKINCTRPARSRRRRRNAWRRSARRDRAVGSNPTGWCWANRGLRPVARTVVL
jgi:hypothetical protein